MTIALQIRVDDLAKRLGEAEARIATLERQVKPVPPLWPAEAADEQGADDNATVEGADFGAEPPKRRGRPRKQL